MTLSEGQSGNESWELGDELLLDAEKINTYAANREGEYVSLKISNMLGKLAAKHTGKSVFVSAGNLLIPDKVGIGYGPGHMSGDIGKFAFGSYATVDDTFELKHKTGVVMMFEVDDLNGFSPEEAKDWRSVVYPEFKSERFVVGMPLIAGNKVMELMQVPSIPDSYESLLGSGSEKTPFAYREYVQKIQSITQSRHSFSQRDENIINLLQQEMAAMNLNCPFLGHVVGVQANYMRQPKDSTPGNYIIIKGGVMGRLRKFVYASTLLDGKVIGDVQAVIYDIDVADAVNEGIITSAEADIHPTTTYVPLSRQHVMLDLENKK